MISEKHVTRGAMLALAIGITVVAYHQRRAHADGIPTSSPMTYAGTLEEAGAPVNGSRNIRLTVWDDPVNTDSAHSRCTTIASGIAVTDGRFQVTLDPACTAVVHSTPDLWLEVEVNGMSLGRTKISAVPFAIEAGRAADLTPAASHALVPPGTIVAYGGDTAPTGWLVCDGAAVSQSMYPALFAAIGTAHGNGGATGMFNLPDYRGRFLRGVDGGAGRDPDRAMRTAANPGGNSGDVVGTLQAAATAMPNTPFTTTMAGAHSHLFGVYGGNFTDGGAASLWTGYPLRENRSTTTAGAHTHGIVGGDSETRPVNASVNFIIKY